MQSTYETAIAQVFRDEGGYTNDAADRGGPTNWGITIEDARLYWKHDATAEDVKNMPRSIASDIYEKHYALPLHYADLPAGVDYAVLDYGINSGISRAAKVLQEIVVVPVDGVIGPITIAAASKVDSVKVINQIYDERLKFLQGLHNWGTFGRGWTARCNNGRRLALQLATKKTAVTPTITHTTTAIAVGTAGAAAASQSPTHFWLIVAGIAVVGVLIGLVVHYFNNRKVTPNVVENSPVVG